jgi:hypothetical protein
MLFAHIKATDIAHMRIYLKFSLSMLKRNIYQFFYTISIATNI